MINGGFFYGMTIEADTLVGLALRLNNKLTAIALIKGDATEEGG
jgi:hypothetical protein